MAADKHEEAEEEATLPKERKPWRFEKVPEASLG